MNDKISLKINTGSIDYVTPTPQGCLEDSNGKFYSTQNAVRLHEWLRGTEVTPLVLEAVKQNKDGLIENRSFGDTNIHAYAKRWSSGQLLTLEQIVIATPDIKDQMAKAIAWADESGHEPKIIEALSMTTQALMAKFNPLRDFTASAIFFNHEIPEKFHYQTLETLDRLCTYVLTQRRKAIYQCLEMYPHSIDLDMYSRADLDLVIGRIHQALMEGVFPDPEAQAEKDGLANAHFFRMCAMAYSLVTETPIPVAYVSTQLSTKFYWAMKVLRSLKEEIPSLIVRPKPQNVVSFPSK